MALTAIKTPSILCLTRQNLPQLEGSSIEKANKGGYVLHDTSAGKPDLTFVATGSEVSLAVDAAKQLEAKGKKVRVVSMPCQEIFDQQPRAYQLECLPDGAPIVSVEAYSVSWLALRTFRVSAHTDMLSLRQTFGWGKYAHEYLGTPDNQFGASAPAPAVYKKFGLVPDGEHGIAGRTVANR